MKIVNIERIVFILVLVGITTGAVYVTNYVRDHEVYRVTAEQCSSDKSILGQEIEQLNAEISLKDSKVQDLKAQPLR